MGCCCVEVLPLLLPRVNSLCTSPARPTCRLGRGVVVVVTREESQHNVQGETAATCPYCP